MYTRFGGIGTAPARVLESINKGENETRECLDRTPKTLHLHIDDPMDYYTYTDNNKSTDGEQSDTPAMDYIYREMELLISVEKFDCVQVAFSLCGDGEYGIASIVFHG